MEYLDILRSADSHAPQRRPGSLLAVPAPIFASSTKGIFDRTRQPRNDPQCTPQNDAAARAEQSMSVARVIVTAET
ncbi:hypothetical protein EV641_101611 [Rhodococcus sp. SMB37]|uniref:hypothetical protein n=1 Tax=Rhodococcus sp. SMB37 TaxID=2512213 RepID=UPI0006D2345C|nr:hypothetical protein [Rhodococcus sp. SMB37]TCN58505.1 hypothetical protein EV641_101611 [Rhodococcus sp. SMB37]